MLCDHISQATGNFTNLNKFSFRLCSRIICRSYLASRRKMHVSRVKLCGECSHACSSMVVNCGRHMLVRLKVYRTLVRACIVCMCMYWTKCICMYGRCWFILKAQCSSESGTDGLNGEENYRRKWMVARAGFRDERYRKEFYGRWARASVVEWNSNQ